MSDPKNRTWPPKKLRIPSSEQTASSPPAARTQCPAIPSPRKIQ